MEKKKAGNAPFYAAMAVCLLAAGVGTWQLLRPARNREALPAASPVTALPAPAAPYQQPPLLNEPALEETGGGEGGQSEADAVSSGGAASNSAASDSTVPVPGNRAAGNGGAGKTESAAPVSGPAAVPASGAAAPAPGTAAAGSGTAPASGTVSLSGTAAAVSGTDAAGSGTGSVGGGTDVLSALNVCLPLEGETVAAFSMERLQYNRTLADWRTHDGVDIAAELGTAVSAVYDGTVESVTEDPLMGVTVTLSHAGGYETTYASLQDAANWEAGDHVPAGAMLGTVGDTAAAEAYQGPHLHFSVKKGGVPVDPMEFLPDT